MITFINKSNASKYRELFDKANEALGFENDNDKISSLEEYFSTIRTLVTSTEDKRYTMLPLDEEVFEIDANKRLITVPPSFKTNGISVQGDQIAEIVYFKIDRFFDATDLNEMDIFIQWQAPNGDQGISKEWVRDIESENGKLIFGWPLSEEITVKSGNVKFAVRFVKFDEIDPNKVLYSFSTLTAEAQIKSALDFDLTKGVIDRFDCSDLILGRLVDSTSPIIGAGTSALPLITDFLESFVDLDKETGEALLHVQAKSTDAGNVTYEWNFYKLVFNEETRVYELEEDPEIVNNGSIVYIPTESTSADPDIDYFYKIKENGVDVYRLADSTDWEKFEDANFAKDDAATLYEKFCQFVAKDIGKYTVTISNKRGKAPGVSLPGEGETFEEYDLVCMVPAPAAPEVTPIHKGDAAGEEIIRYIIREPGKETPTMSDGKEPDISVTLYASATVSDAEYSELEYQWTKTGVDIPEAKAEAYIVSGENAEGNYALRATNYRNGYEWAIASAPCRVSYPPINPQILTPTGNYLINTEIDASLFIVMAGGHRADSLNGFKYQWYKENVAGDDVKIEGATSNIFVPDKGGIYKVEIFSVYNGATLINGTMSDEIKVVEAE